MSSPLVKKPIVDKNGKKTTVNVRADGGAADKARSLPLPTGNIQPEDAVETRIVETREVLDNKLTSILGEHELFFDTTLLHGDPNYRVPDMTTVDVNFTIPARDDDGSEIQVGVSAIFRATDIHWIKDGYRGSWSGDIDSESEAKLTAAVDAVLPELKAYHDALFESVNGRSAEAVEYVTNPEEARAFLLAFAGYDQWHEQNNGRLVGMTHKIAQQERYAHKMPEIFAAVEILESVDQLQIADFSDKQYAKNRDMYKRIRASEISG